MRLFRSIVIATCALAASPVHAKGDAVPALPTYAGAYEPQTVDERGLWMQFDEAERRLRDSKAVIKDPQLTKYLHDVVCRTVGKDRCDAVRLYVVRDASFNASMAPNGMLIVQTGLLLRARNEAELAAVLGHEFAHFELRHTLLHFKNQRTATDIFAWAGVAAAGAYAYGGSGSYRTAQTARSIQVDTMGAMYANGRDQEREADLLSMAYLQSSPYDPRCFAHIWERFMDEADASARGRKQHSTRYDRVSFFATHPTSLERATYLRDIAVAMGKSGEEDDARYAAALAAWRPQFLADQIKLNDFDGTDYLLGQLAGTAWTPDLQLARGELYRTRGNPRDLVSAITFYRATIAQQPANADAYRGMGLAQMRSGDPAAAATLGKYLELRPDAPDRAMVSALLQ